MSWLSSMLFGKQTKVNTDFSELSNQANEYSNPLSKLNQNMLMGLTNQATDIVAQQGLSNQRMQAMGLNPFAQQQQQQMLSTVTGQAGQGWNSWLNNAANVSTGLLTNKSNLTFERDKTNALLQQQRQAQVSDFMGKLLGQFATSSIPGNLAGGFMNLLSPKP